MTIEQKIEKYRAELIAKKDKEPFMSLMWMYYEGMLDGIRFTHTLIPNVNLTTDTSLIQ